MQGTTISINERVKNSLTSIKVNVEEVTFLPTLVRMLSQGQPVSVEQLAGAADISTERVRTVLAKHRSVEWDELGRIVGFGLTLRPTTHKFTFEGTTVYGWCASDALIFPVILGKKGLVEAECPITKLPIQIEVTPQQVLQVNPPQAVVSEVRPAKRVSDVRTDICGVGHFISSREAAAGWLEKHPEGMVNSVADDFEIHRRVMEELGWAGS